MLSFRSAISDWFGAVLAGMWCNVVADTLEKQCFGLAAEPSYSTMCQKKRDGPIGLDPKQPQTEEYTSGEVPEKNGE